MDSQCDWYFILLENMVSFGVRVKPWGTEKKPKTPSRWSAGLFVILCVAVSLATACSGSSKNEIKQSKDDSAIVNYSCIANPQSEKKIYVILKNYHGEYWETVIEGITQASNEVDAAIYMGGIDNETDTSGQIKLIDEAIEEGADGILLAPANSSSLEESCHKIQKKKIPLTLIDSSINSGEFDACYMTDNIEAGKMAAKEMLTMLQEEGNNPAESLEVGIALSADTSQAMVNRVSGFLEYWANYAPVEWSVAKDIYLNGGDISKAETDVAKLLKEHSDMKGIFGCNNTSTIGIVNTLKKEKKTNVVMVGFDLSEETRAFIQDPDYRGASLMQKQDQMGYLGMCTLDSLIKGTELKQKYFDTGIIMIDSKYLMENNVS